MKTSPLPLLLSASFLLSGCTGQPEPGPSPVTSPIVVSTVARKEPTPTPAADTAKSSPAPADSKRERVTQTVSKSPPSTQAEGDGGAYQARKQGMIKSLRRGATAKADRRLVAAVTGKEKSISDSIQSRTFELGIQWLLESARYDDLERFGDYYRDSRERLATGQLKSTIFYYALKTPRVPNGGRWLPAQLFEWKAARPQSPHAQIACARLLMEVAEGRWNGDFEKLKGEMAAAFDNPLPASRKCLEKAAKLAPSGDIYALLIDQVRREGGTVEEGQQYLDKADQVEPGGYHAEAQFARLLNERGRNWVQALSSPENAYFAAMGYLDEKKANVRAKEWVTYAQAAEKAYPKSALIKNVIARQAARARDFELAAKKFAELGDRFEVYAWDDAQDFYTERNKLEDRGLKVRTGAFFPLPETPSELRDLPWEDDLLIRQTAELYQRQQFAELEAIASVYRGKTARLRDSGRKVSRMYAAIEDEYWTKGVEGWERSVLAERYRKLFPASTMAATLAGKAATTEAWDIRGSGYADSVSKSDWEGFRERLEVADAYLQEARERPGAKDPELYQASITVAMGLSWDKADTAELLKQAQAVDPLAPEPYQAMAIYLLPRWKGSQEELESFLSKIPLEVYPSVIPACAEDIETDDPKVRARMVKGLQARAQRFSNAETWSRVLLMAAAAGDRKAGAQAVAKLRGDWSPNAIMSAAAYNRLVAWSQGGPLK